MTDTPVVFDNSALQPSSDCICLKELPGGLERAVSSLTNFASRKGEQLYGWNADAIGIFTPENAEMWINRNFANRAGFIDVVSCAPGLADDAIIRLNLLFTAEYIKFGGFDNLWGSGSTRFVFDSLKSHNPWDYGPIPSLDAIASITQLETAAQKEQSSIDRSARLHPSNSSTSRDRSFVRRDLRRVV